tara:strand:+ start:1441 stop:2325 length:885 start_codon:yes stop_codon:yes gene_type:complete
MKTKGIILAGGFGSRLFPLTYATSKQLLPVYDKPMIYYPLSVLMIAGIREILIITTKSDINNYKKLLNDGRSIGINISYQIQDYPRGIADCFNISKNFSKESNICLILGDNIFHGTKITDFLASGIKNLNEGFSTIFGVEVPNPNDFGVIQFDSKDNIKCIIEKPNINCGNFIVSGLYFYTNDVLKYVKRLKPSSRGELEITDINNIYINNNKLRLIKLDNSVSWIDTGTYDSLLKASKFFQKLEIDSGEKSACIHEIAFKMGYIDIKEFKRTANSMSNSEYGMYLIKKYNFES